MLNADKSEDVQTAVLGERATTLEYVIITATTNRRKLSLRVQTTEISMTDMHLNKQLR